MSTVYVVRHGRIASPSGDAHDPPLSVEGHAQAAAVARELCMRLPEPLPVLTSPLLRCRQTAAVLCAVWQLRPTVEARVAEVPVPDQLGLSRAHWLAQMRAGTWTRAVEHGEKRCAGYGEQLTRWRQQVCETILEQATDTVIFSHYMPINALMARAMDLESVACVHPDHASVTVFEVVGGQLRLLERGREANTPIG